MIGMTTPVTKYNYQVRNAKDIPRIIHEAFYLANTGRKGPVVIDIPKTSVFRKSLMKSTTNPTKICRATNRNVCLFLNRSQK